MDQPPEQIQSELESFRRQWQEEVSSRTKKPAPAPASPPRRHHEPPSHTKEATSVSSKIGQLDDDDDEDYVPAPVFEGDGSSSVAKKGGHTLDEEKAKEPKTALDFYEHAVERETTGKLGDSLQLYRKAFRMDEGVDRKYRDKHFAGRWGKQAAQQQQQQQQQQQINPSNAAVTVPNTAHHSLEGSGSGEVAIPLSFPELIASFASLKVEGAPPECEGVDPPPCPIAGLPDEILVHILRDVATADVGDFVRLSQVCRRLAYLVATEDQIWRRVCIGSEFGFGGMHRHFQSSITWEPLSLSEALAESAEAETEVEAVEGIYTLEDLQHRRAAAAHATTLSLYRNVAAGGYATWQSMFRRRPRIRFNGCYISTVNYIRPGVNSGQHLTWNTPVHIVTYYRYLRLFRDGTAISLLTTDEPAHVVHHLTKENIPSQRGSAHHAHQHQHQHQHQHLPQPAMSSALKGRWRLSSSAQDDNTTESEESDLYIETEGAVGAKYTYRLDLSLQSAGSSRKQSSATRNNKLVWRGFWSYNRLTDDWAQFTLKNDKPFFFSRVKSYGMGE
ncbi:F-box domain-containing protein [Xylaria flabelliformis]|nr:F-box domain-containing protein [Xylaria flabelliformis]